MSEKRQYTFTTRKRPTTTAEILALRFRDAKASPAIEGLHLTSEEIAVFEECVRKECTLEERTALLKKRFPDHDAVRA